MRESSAIDRRVGASFVRVASVLAVCLAVAGGSLAQQPPKPKKPKGNNANQAASQNAGNQNQHNPPSSADGKSQPPKLVTWGYLRMHDAATVFSFLNRAKAGKISDDDLGGLASPELLSVMKANVPGKVYTGTNIPKPQPRLMAKSHAAAVVKKFGLPVIGRIAPKTAIKVDAGKFDYGDVAQGQSASFSYTAMIPTRGAVKVLCIGPTWKIKSVQLLSGEIDGSTKTQKVQRTIKAPVSGSSVQVKAGQ
ncbi:MAG: hypothetical protein ACYC96_15665, partial [Fimbriimonadaceae bacterium]